MLTLLVLVASWSVSLVAGAQDCVEGRERVEGFCCWPGQTFSTSARRCEGVPACPEALVEHGEECVAPLGPPARVPDIAPVPAYDAFVALPPLSGPTETADTSGWPATREASVVHHAVRRHGEDGGLIALSVVIFDIGWVMGLVVGALDAARDSCSSFSSGRSTNCNSWQYAFIPVGGGIFSGMTNFAPSSFRTSSGWGFGLGIPSVLLQTIGLISLAIALANEVTDIGLPAIAVDGVTLSFVGAAQGADAGASLVLAF